jgi:hypothetical protein
MSTLEHQTLTEKAQFMAELQSMERKLSQACVDLEERTITITKLTDTLRFVLN